MNDSFTPILFQQPLEPRSIEEYIDYIQNTYDLILWGGGKIKAYLLSARSCQWVLFPITLQSGYYQIALALTTPPKVRPVTAYAVAFKPGDREIEGYPLLSTGFHMTPATAGRNPFDIHHNIVNFISPISGLHTIAVTTRDWFTGVENTHFEVALFKSKMKYVGKSRDK